MWWVLLNWGKSSKKILAQLLWLNNLKLLNCSLFFRHIFSIKHFGLQMLLLKIHPFHVYISLGHRHFAFKTLFLLAAIFLCPTTYNRLKVLCPKEECTCHCLSFYYIRFSNIEFFSSFGIPLKHTSCIRNKND